MTIGELIKERRMEMNMTQMQLADTVGTTTATISRWESGDIHQMKRDMIEATATALRIDPVLFFRNNDVIFPEERKVLSAYRAADDLTKAMVRRTLNIEEKNDGSKSAI